MDINIFKKDELTALAVRMKKGDRKAAAKLYDALFSKTYGFFFARTGHRESAEDLSQDIFLKLVEKIESFDETRGGFVVWFWQVARNMLIDHYRAKKETPFSHFEEDKVEAMAISEMPDVDSQMRYRSVQLLLKDMSDDERDLFELRYMAEMSYREIAKLLGKSEGALRVAHLRVKEKIKKQFQNEV